MRELLIVGIDPGTTLGYAVLDITGNVLEVKSSKQLELNSLLEELVKLGSILAIGTDKAKAPSLVEKAAAKTGARVITPREDLLVSEKAEITRGKAFASEHEKDALAAALHAHKGLEPLLGRIRKTLEEEGKLSLLREVTEIVVMENRNIKDAIRTAEEILTEEVWGKTAETQPEAYTAKETKAHENLILQRTQRENDILRSYSSKLLAKARHLNRELRKAALQMKREESEKNIQKRERNSTMTIAKLHQIISGKDNEIGRIAEETKKLEIILSSGEAIARKMETLGLEELEQKNKSIPISEGTIILVENPDIFSEKALRLLQQKNATVLARKKPSPNVTKILRANGIAILPAEGIIGAESKKFASASKKRLTEAKKETAGTNALGIIESYKEERKNLV